MSKTNSIVDTEPVNTKAILDEKSKNMNKLHEGTRLKRNFSLKYSEKFVQTIILLLTVYMVGVKFNTISTYNDIFTTVTKLFVFFFAQIFKNFSIEEGIDTLPPFEIIYSFYLPFMLSLLLDENLVYINTILSFNVIENVNYVTRFLLQALLILFLKSDPIESIAAIFINMGFAWFLEKIGELKSLDNIDCNLFSILLTNILFLIGCPDSIPFQILKGTVIAFLITITINYWISFPLKKYVKNQHLKSMALLSNFVITFPFLTDMIIILPNSAKEQPVKWLFNYIFESRCRQIILLTWLSFLLILIPNILMFHSNFSLNTSRKVWHFIILLLILKPFKIDQQFIKIALSGTIPLFLSVEYLRYLKLEPIGKYLDSRLRSFSDFRDDKGPIIISYIYLIIGISFPLLVANSPVGLISLGIGDSMASIIGGRYGKLKWKGTSKTVEGTIAFVLSTSCVSAIAKYYMNYFEDLSWIGVFTLCLLSGLLEGNSILNDNIMIPAFMLICEKLLITS
ncbi:hypothetical protein KAFR_0A02090 [Kazachstania africana CBS 2517]|uniref:dolichol kinase n=1 Tax=Kazachstania africana (strain ATCC 22294 / BCRC 22015 / CBS 2517 / CECT 1963 / NBRC 1671 / NRRL Y-8276) TaxID=1071382 RepID=H2AMP7_KAZAF|nr:hypothetical protein KAFR_0A02090 [Kazachstania africana CBS 2517]CCF55647.1 hypothetical protein KAFR_0A02090 [Kazachstania africana CBS 2517]